MKKKSNSVETLVVIILILALGGYAALTYLIKPLQSRNEALEADLIKKEGELLTQYATTTSYGAKTERLNTVKQALDDWNGVFYSGVNEEYLIDHIRKNLSENKLSMISLTVKTNQANLVSQLKESGNVSAAYAASFPEGTEAVLDLNTFKKAFDSMKSDKGSRISSEITTTSMTLSCGGSYRDMLKFLTSLKTSGQTIIINSLSVELPENVTISKNEEAAKANPNCTFTISIVFVDIPAANTYAEKYTAEELVPYVFPPNILNQTYRSSASGLAGLLGNLTK